MNGQSFKNVYALVVVQNLTATNVTLAGFSLQWIMRNKCRGSEKLNSTQLEVQMGNRTWNV